MYSDFYEILFFVRACRSASRISVWDRFGLPDYLETEDALNELTARGWLRCKRGSSRYYDTLTVTALGREQLDAADIQRCESAERERRQQASEAQRLAERRKDHADAERRYRAQNKIAIIMPLVTFILGVLAEHFFQLVRLIVS